MTGLSRVIQADPARWQRQAAAELAALLDAPGSCGHHLDGRPGRVPGLAPAWHVREVSGAWRAALALEEYREHQPGGAATWLHAAARRELVRIRLTATVPAGVQEDQ